MNPPATGFQGIDRTEFQLPGQTAFYRGKVRDVYTIDERLLVMVASDRISAFDVVLPRPIPYKGQVLNQLAAYFLEKTADIAPNWVLEQPNPRVTIGWRAEPVKVEMVIRGYLTGHAWRTYRRGQRTLCGVSMPEGLREHDAFPSPIITPAVKAETGHDEDISREDLLKAGMVSESVYRQMEDYTYALFRRGSEMAKERGLILVDTKYEFGVAPDGKVILIDEIHTPDSSRYFYLEGYAERQRRREPQRQLSKEFVREWLMAGGFQGRDGEQVPEMTDAFVQEVSERYIELYEKVSGRRFNPDSGSADPVGKMLAEIEAALHRLR